MSRRRFAAVLFGFAALVPVSWLSPTVAQDEFPEPAEYGFLKEFRVAEQVSAAAIEAESPISPVHPASLWEESPEPDDEQTLEERLAKLEKGWGELDKAWSKFDAAEKKKKEDAGKKPTFKINGRIHADHWDFLDQSEGIGYFENPTPGPTFGQDPEDTFAFRRIRLETAGDIPDNMLWRVQIDFNNPNLPEMKDVYLGFKELPLNQVLLIGNQKRPLGLDHLNSSRNNVFLERPDVVEAFNSDARRPGFCFHGNTDDLEYIWSYGAFYLENIANDGRYRGDSRQMSVNGRFASSPWYDEATDGRGYFHWAVAGMAAHPDGDAGGFDKHSNEARFASRPEARSDTPWLDTGRITGANTYEILAAEAMLNLGPLQYVGEFQKAFVQRDSGFADTGFQGGYVYASYFLTGEHIPYDRATGTLGRVIPYENFFLVDGCSGGHRIGWGALNVAARYSCIDLTDQDILGGQDHAGTLALNWHWNPNAKVQFNLIYGTIDEHTAVAGYTSGEYLIAGTRFAVDF